MFKEKIIIEMKEVFKEIPFGIEHTLKVLKKCRRYNERRKYRRGRKRIHQYYCYTT